MRAVRRDEDGSWRNTLRGRQVLADPRINKGTAFDNGERHDLGLTGLIPSAHFTLEDQADGPRTDRSAHPVTLIAER